MQICVTRNVYVLTTNSVIDFVYIRPVDNNEAKRRIFPQIYSCSLSFL